MEEQFLPIYILIENVACFENSQTHSLILDTLNQRNYTFQEFLLSPTQFAIPNQRLRYFCLVHIFFLKNHFFILPSHFLCLLGKAKTFEVCSTE